MELPTEVLIHNAPLGMKGAPGKLIAISEHGFYEVNCAFGDKIHRVLLPIGATVLIAREPEEPPEAEASRSSASQRACRWRHRRQHLPTASTMPTRTARRDQRVADVELLDLGQRGDRAHVGGGQAVAGVDPAVRAAAPSAATAVG